MKPSDTPCSRNRRLLLAALATGGGSALAPLAPGRASPPAAGTDPVTSSRRDESSGRSPRGYRETAHVRSYYRTLR